jgi:hypothetical protein
MLNLPVSGDLKSGIPALVEMPVWFKKEGLMYYTTTVVS